jgi:hypothetical protein
VWAKYSRKLFDLYSDQIILICVMGGEGTLRTEFRWESLREGGHSKHIGADEIIILKWIFKNWDGV